MGLWQVQYSPSAKKIFHINQSLFLSFKCHVTHQMNVLLLLAIRTDIDFDCVLEMIFVSICDLLAAPRYLSLFHFLTIALLAIEILWADKMSVGAPQISCYYFIFPSNIVGNHLSPTSTPIVFCCWCFFVHFHNPIWNLMEIISPI